ncbi:hypothetical protein [Blastopirellula marina]|uniref:Uncharacterized protein n=1 Tax=Blastopirellula marina TaxID=124 RepID=A0A2S8GMI7_9BACT|nr:hypothetical protein [Blastopirellula marina]PQO45632.1 hypothetical protein C5Y93_14445 [Blastopirellula marina]
MIRSMMLLAVLTVGLVWVSVAEAGGGCRPGYGGYGYGYAPYGAMPVRSTYYRGYSAYPAYYRPVNVSPFYNTYPSSLYYNNYRGYGVGGAMGYGRYGYGPSYHIGF